MRRSLILSFLLVAVVAVSPARASAILDFGSGFAGPGGTVSYAGGSSALVGQGIRIGALIGFNTPDNAGTYAITGNNASYGVLNFRTGAYQGFSNNNYQFAGGGYFEIFGNVAAAGVSGNDTGFSGQGGGALLLSGSFTGAQMSANGVGGAVSFFTPTGFDTKNAALVDFFGLAANTLFALSGYSVEVGNVRGNGAPFTSIALGSTDIVNTAVPEPASLLMLGSGLTLLGSAIRRRRRLMGTRN